MKERPIIFSGPMVLAIRDGQKTQTRRIVKQQPTFIESSGRWLYQLPPKFHTRGRCASVCTASREWWEYLPAGALPCEVGDRYWVRETWGVGPSRIGGFTDAVIKKEYKNWIIYRADGGLFHREQKWRSPIHMYRWASRITLAVVGVRAERLQGITPIDVYKEGVGSLVSSHRDIAQELFAQVWNNIHGEDAWHDNPWVWVIEFKRI